MSRIIIGPAQINKVGLDNVGKLLTRRLYKLKNDIDNHAKIEILFLNGISIGDISYLLRNVLKLLDTETELNVKTKVDLEAVNNLDEINIVVKIV